MKPIDTAALDQVENIWRGGGSSISRERKAALGQFMTPSSVARFMATLFMPPQFSECRLLDAGAGVGCLSSAFLDHWADRFSRVDVTAYEIDDALQSRLAAFLERYVRNQGVKLHIEKEDFIESAVNWLQFIRKPPFTHAILNPPYKKIHSESRHRLLLRQVGIETVNLYSAFVALTVAMVGRNGEVVAIIPRSFCNGPYYRPFREFVLRRAAIRHLHLFDSRRTAFKEDGVLQENVIIALECGGKQGMVTVSTSTDDTFTDYLANAHPFERIVFPSDSERFVHIPTDPGLDSISSSDSIRWSLQDIGVMVSTGPVVDFRVREHLRNMPEPGTVPLLYPGHISGYSVEWPKVGFKKPNAILRNDKTESLVYPNGFYTVVRRFSSKEERRRLVAAVVGPNVSPDSGVLGFENHLNVFHERKRGLPEDLAHGLAVFLNATATDNYFRRFNGHTQVNATDLRAMRFPNRGQLMALGRWAKKQRELMQETIDQKLAQLE